MKDRLGRTPFHYAAICNDGGQYYQLLQQYGADKDETDNVSTNLHSVEKPKIYSTVWKFHDFSITQILREINFGDSRSAKSAILPHLQALNFDCLEFLHFLKAKIYQIYKSESL